MALLSAFILATVGCMAVAGVTINLTPSYPRGLYLGKPITPGQSIPVNTMVLACPDLSNPAIQAANHYRFLAPGSCQGGLAPFIKTVAGRPGDTVERQKEGVKVNGTLLPRTAPIHENLFPAPIQTGYRHQLARGEYWLISDYHPDSFDSRYYGPVAGEYITKTLRPFITEKEVTWLFN